MVNALILFIRLRFPFAFSLFSSSTHLTSHFTANDFAGAKGDDIDDLQHFELLNLNFCARTRSCRAFTTPHYLVSLLPLLLSPEVIDALLLSLESTVLLEVCFFVFPIWVLSNFSIRVCFLTAWAWENEVWLVLVENFSTGNLKVVELNL